MYDGKTTGDLSMKVLALSANYEPLGVVSWERAITLVYSDKVSVVEEYDCFVRSPSVQVKIPAVVVFKKSFIGNKRLSKWFNVSQLRTNIVPPESLQEAIIAKTKAIQQAEAAEQQALTAFADGKRKVAVARADSAETIIKANASALSMKIKQRELTPLYVEFLKAQAWDGKLPTTVAGGSGTFLNIK